MEQAIRATSTFHDAVRSELHSQPVKMSRFRVATHEELFRNKRSHSRRFKIERGPAIEWQDLFRSYSLGGSTDRRIATGFRSLAGTC